MSLPIIVLLVLGYVAVVAVILALVTAAKRSDARADREHEALAREPAARRSRRFAKREDPAREQDPLRRIG